MSRTGQEITTQEDMVLSILLDGQIEIYGQLVLGSNYSFLASIKLGNQEIEVVYKPVKGSYQLWDFDLETLPNRETAAYQISRLLNWNLVPPTVIRSDAPFGLGSLQLFIDHDPEINYFTFNKKYQQELKRIVLFDMIINNADRKGSHILRDNRGHLWLIDHGLCFHTDPKLRTVVWDFGGKKISRQLLDDLTITEQKLKMDDMVRQKVSANINQDELRALQQRICGIIEHTVYPYPDENRRSYPWPLV